MYPGLLLHPLSIYAALLIACTAAVYLFCSIRSEARAAAGLGEARQQAIDKTLAELKAALRELQADATERQAIAASALPRASMNITTRIDAIRLARQGEQPGAIANALGV